MSFFHRIEPILYSRKNIAGCLLALGGLALYFLGITSGLIGLAVIAGLYGIGYLVVPPERGLAVTLFGTEDTHDITNGLTRLLASIRFRVADDVYNEVGSICHAIVETLPANGTGINPADPNVNLIRQTALSYLPQALDAYLAIPRLYAERRTVQDGKTAHDILMDQLNLMDSKMKEMANAIAQNDTERLLANARFVQDRFASSALQLTPASVAAAAQGSDGTKIV
ncbi:MAG TPA: hypothetical protein VIK08_00180 [Candidatus Limnocylindrales bacterium]